jgi:stage II sporulation protein D
MRRRALLLLLPILGCAWALPGRSSDEEGEPTVLPPVRVRLASLGTPAKFTITPSGAVSASDPKSGESLELPEGLLTVKAAGDQVAVGEALVASLRVAAPELVVGAGKSARTYPEALIVTAAAGKLTLVNECSLERYTEGVLVGECPARFHPEAIRAIAIAARSYSYRKAYLSGTDLCDTTSSQVYLGIGKVAASQREAVEATRRMVGQSEGQVIDAVYSADCGGHTEANEDVWKGSRPLAYLRPVEDAPEPGGVEFCNVNRSHTWTVTLPKARLQSLVGKKADEIRLQVPELTAGGRARQVVLTAESDPDATEPGLFKTFTGDVWRRTLGLDTLKSLRFEVEETETGVTIHGRGWGHGVGLCQWGANGMARSGFDHGAILKHYYTGIEIAPAPRVTAMIARTLRTRLASRKGRGAVKGPRAK